MARGGGEALVGLLVVALLVGGARNSRVDDPAPGDDDVVAEAPAPESGAPLLPPGTTFEDDDGSRHEGAIEALVDAGVAFGCEPAPTERYCPDEPVRRGEFAVFLTRALDVPPRTTTRFLDVADHRYAPDIAALGGADIAIGCDPPADRHYCPDEWLRRDQLAGFLHRGLPGLPVVRPGAGDFLDVTADEVFRDDIVWLARVGVTEGCNAPTSTLFCPDNGVTRGQLATFLARALGLVHARA